MKRLLTAAAIFVAFLTLPLVAPVQAQEYFFLSVLTGDQEVPPIETKAYGVAFFYVYYVEEGKELVPIIYYYIYTQGLETRVTGFHIHPGRPGMNGPVILPMNNPAGEGDFLESDGYLTAADLRPGGGIQTFDEAIIAMFGDKEGPRLYTNVHTQQSPGGRIRGAVFPYVEE